MITKRQLENATCVLDPSHFRYPLFTVTYSVVLVLGLPLNAVSLWCLFRRLKLQSVPVVYMTNLAISDLLFVLSLPLRIYYFSTATWPFGQILCMVPGTLFSVNIYSSSLFITLISVDRFLAVVYPLRSRAIRTTKFAAIACGSVWVFILGLSIPVALNHSTSYDTCHNITRCFESFSPNSWYFGFIILCLITGVGILIPFVIIASSTLVVIWKIRNETHCSMPDNKKKITRMFIANLLMYAFCFIPFHAAFILYGLYKLDIIAYNFLDIQTITMCFASANSCLDPIIYYFVLRAFKKRKDDNLELRTLRTSVLQR
ncbi:lysophosphatidic acid receptor 5a [Lepisosteus oculatus]|uniref:lysophosphatidic acid receptor 5a n=1 Tax=Lepisosteus oculatus TaxID=7918 RepID=UPI0003EAA097|nr:PREDICTED: lysophosphatidic acid receptor 4-like [Lepisosteus oculatus]